MKCLWCDRDAEYTLGTGSPVVCGLHWMRLNAGDTGDRLLRPPELRQDRGDLFVKLREAGVTKTELREFLASTLGMVSNKPWHLLLDKERVS